jgi:hypothetical protein
LSRSAARQRVLELTLELEHEPPPLSTRLHIPLNISKTSLVLSLALLPALLLAGCVDFVTSKTPVGDKPAALDPKLWNGIWQDENGGLFRTRIKDANLGVVEIRSRSSPLDPGKTDDLLVRALGDITITNIGSGGSYAFERVDISGKHLLVFDPNASTFSGLIEDGKISGSLDRDSNGKPTGSSTIDGLSERDYHRLKRDGIDPHDLFKDDPTDVLIRYHWIPFW